MLGRAAALLIRFYQLTLGRAFGGRCRFHPTCSEFAVRALRTNGIIIGAGQSMWRVLRCGPWTSGGVDYPAPLTARARASEPAVRHG
jgi:putative membrane protein insertion efficiency factor